MCIYKDGKVILLFIYFHLKLWLYYLIRMNLIRNSYVDECGCIEVFILSYDTFESDGRNC